MRPSATRTPARRRSAVPSNTVTPAKYVLIGSGSISEPRLLAERRALRRVHGRASPEQVRHPIGQLGRGPPGLLAELGHGRPPLIELDQTSLDVEQLPGDVRGAVAGEVGDQWSDVLRRQCVELPRGHAEL